MVLFDFKSNGKTYYSDIPNVSYFKHWTFDDLEAEATRSGKGALQQGKGTIVELYNDTLPINDTMVLSYWMKNDYLYHRPNLHYKLYDPEGNEIYQMSVDAAKALNYQNGWVMVEIEIKPQVSGIVDEIYVEAGQLISKGDKIALVKIIPNMVSLNNAENRVRQAEISLENAQLDLNRNKQLKDQAVIAAAEFQQFEIAIAAQQN